MPTLTQHLNNAAARQGNINISLLLQKFSPTPALTMQDQRYASTHFYGSSRWYLTSIPEFYPCYNHGQQTWQQKEDDTFNSIASTLPDQRAAIHLPSTLNHSHRTLNLLRPKTKGGPLAPPLVYSSVPFVYSVLCPLPLPLKNTTPENPPSIHRTTYGSQPYLWSTRPDTSYLSLSENGSTVTLPIPTAPSLK